MMKKFWTRSGLKKPERNIETKSIHGQLESTSTNGETQGFHQLPPKFLLRSGIELNKRFPKTSRLTKRLIDVLTDKSALNYFIQYVDAKRDNAGLALVKFWLDVENYHAAVHLSRTDSNRMNRSLSHDCRLDRLSSAIRSSDSTPTFNGKKRTISSQSGADDQTTFNMCDINESPSDSMFDSGTELSAASTTCSNNKSCDSCLESSGNFPTNLPEDPRMRRSCSLSKNDGFVMQLVTDEARRIFNKFIATNESTSSQRIEFPETIRGEIERVVEGSVITSDCFKSAQQFVYDKLHRDYFDAFVKSNLYVNHQVDILTSGNIQISDVLHNDTALFYFVEYLEQQQCRYLFDCWISLFNFQNQMNLVQDETKEQLQSDAMVLYNKYFSLQATHCLGFPDSVRFQVEQNICTETGIVTPDCFDVPIRLIENVLDEYHLKTFVTSQLYYQYITELISVIQNTSPRLNDHAFRRRNSDCSSELSAPSFTVDDEPIKRRKSNKHLTPDELWRKRKSDGLVLGRVNELGRFETNYDKVVDLTSGDDTFNLANMMRRLVNFGEDKAKEEMAWQVAEMIVKDITSVTRGECN